MALPSAYPLPNAVGESAQETARLNALQEVWILELGSLSLRPFPKDARKAVDLGCGTGIWARTMAPQYPNTMFVGVDINPPIEGKLETSATNNCSFVKANIEEDWTFIDIPGSVDYFLARLITTGIRNWQSLYDRAFSATSPGGYFESQECWIGLRTDDDEKYKSEPGPRWFRCLAEFSQSNGVEVDSIDKHAQRLQAAGFNIVAEKPILKFLSASRPEMKGRERVGDLELDTMCGIIDGMSPRIFSSFANMSLEEGLKLAADAKMDLRTNSGERGYCTRNHVVLAQKPQ